MYTEFKIRRLRGISDLRVRNLCRVNLVLGKNSSGKSTLLEGLYLMGSGQDALSPVRASMMRRRQPVGAVLGLQSIFPNLDPHETVEVSARWDGEAGNRIVRISALPIASIEVPSSSGSQGVAAPSSDNFGGLQVEFERPGAELIKADVRIQRDGERIETSVSRPGLDHPMALLSSGASLDQRDAHYLSALKQEKRDAGLASGLGIIDSRLTDVQVVATLTGTPAIVADMGLPRLLPIDDCGGGVTRLLGILLALYVCRDGVVLIDELEDGLHHTVLPKLWKLIDEVSRANNVQVVATTHSDELLKSALKHFELAPECFAAMRMDRRANGSHSVAVYDREMQQAVLREGFEVRG